MKTEALIGIGAGVLCFLAFKGFNIIPVLLLAGLAWFLIFSGTGMSGLRDIGRKKIGNLAAKSQAVSFAEVGGQNVAKRELTEALGFLKNYDQAKKLGIRPIKGILLSGPPGTGKTLLAKAAANYTDSVFISASGSEFIEVYAGLGAQRVRELFSRARKLAKEQKKPGAIIFIDEIEVLAGKRGTQVGHLEYDQTLNQLLVEMDGLTFEDDVRILVIGATNRQDLLDNAIQRPGRFDRMVRVDLPDKVGRKEILSLHLRNKPLADDCELEELARETFGLSGAHLESLCNEAAIIALRSGRDEICKADLTEALDKVLLGEKLERRPTETELRRVSVHEAGHAIVSELIRPGSVAQVTVAPRGNALGYVRHAPREDMYLYPKEFLEEDICVLLAGAMAEDLIFGSRSTGAGNDFKRALELAKRIVSYGMSSLGPADRDTAAPEILSKTTREIVTSAENRTRSLLKKHKKTLKTLAGTLYEQETIQGDNLRIMIKESAGISRRVAWKWRKPPILRGKLRNRVEILP
jgi:cell division protease FtsH